MTYLNPNGCMTLVQRSNLFRDITEPTAGNYVVHVFTSMKKGYTVEHSVRTFDLMAAVSQFTKLRQLVAWHEHAAQRFPPCFVIPDQTN